MNEHKEPHWASFREVMAGLIATAVIGAICYNALVEQSEAAITALVSASGAVSGWLYRQAAANTTPNGNTNGGTNGGTNGYANGTSESPKPPNDKPAAY